MSIMQNSYQVYFAPNPKLVKDHFVLNGRRYFLLSDYALINEPNKNNFLPPPDRGFYLKLPIKDFKEAKALYDLKKNDWLKTVGYLNEGVKKHQVSFSF